MYEYFLLTARTQFMRRMCIPSQDRIRYGRQERDTMLEL